MSELIFSAGFMGAEIVITEEGVDWDGGGFGSSRGRGVIEWIVTDEFFIEYDGLVKGEEVVKVDPIIGRIKVSVTDRLSLSG